MRGLISHTDFLPPCSGAWLVGPTYLIYELGQEIIEGLTMASSGVVALKSD